MDKTEATQHASNAGRGSLSALSTLLRALVDGDADTYVGGAQVTSTADELNLLDGVTSTTADLNLLDGVTSTTAELNDLDVSARTQAIVAAGAIDLDARHVTLTTGAGYAVTLAAPTRAGIVKVIQCLDGTNNVTLLLTNVIGQSAGTTAIFNAADETFVLVSTSLKWCVIGEAAVTFS